MRSGRRGREPGEGVGRGVEGQEKGDEHEEVQREVMSLSLPPCT